MACHASIGSKTMRASNVVTKFFMFNMFALHALHRAAATNSFCEKCNPMSTSMISVSSWREIDGRPTTLSNMCVDPWMHICMKGGVNGERWDVRLHANFPPLHSYSAGKR